MQRELPSGAQKMMEKIGAELVLPELGLRHNDKCTIAMSKTRYEEQEEDCEDLLPLLLRRVLHRQPSLARSLRHDDDDAGLASVTKDDDRLLSSSASSPIVMLFVHGHRPLSSLFVTGHRRSSSVGVALPFGGRPL